MRKLFLMYGAPASGKSYILNKLRVEDYGAENWYKYCKENKIKEFIPQLVKDLYNRGI